MAVDLPARVEVIGYYGGATGIWDLQDFWCPRSRRGNADYNNNTIAHVYLSKLTDIYVSPKFFGLPAVGEESRASSVLHELMHLAGTTLDPTTYTRREAENLARNDPSSARRNAQNLEFFAIDIVYGLR